MMSFRRRLLLRLMCFVMGLSFGANAGAHQKKKSSSNESLTLPEWITIIPTIILGHELMLKPLAGKLFSKGGDAVKCGMIEFSKKYTGVGNEVHKKYKLNQIEEEKKAYIEKVLSSIDITVDESLKYEFLKTIPKSLERIRMALHCLFLNYSNKEGEDIVNAKLTIGEKINWSFTYDEENYVSSNDVRGILEWYGGNSSNVVFFNDLTPIEKFGFVIQEWVKKMGFESVEIVMDGVGGLYAGDYWQSSVKFKIHGFKYQLSDDEREILMEKLGLKYIDTLEVFNDNEVIEIKCENMEDNNEVKKIIVLKDDDN